MLSQKLYSRIKQKYNLLPQLNLFGKYIKKEMHYLYLALKNTSRIQNANKSKEWVK